MALTVAYNGTLTDPASGAWRTVMTAIPGTAVYAATFDFADYDGTVMAIQWRTQVGGTWSTVWATSFTVETTMTIPPNGQSGYLTPPVPVATQGELQVGFATGPGTGVIRYEIYRL